MEDAKNVDLDKPEAKMVRLALEEFNQEQISLSKPVQPQLDQLKLCRLYQIHQPQNQL